MKSINNVPSQDNAKRSVVNARSKVNETSLLTTGWRVNKSKSKVNNASLVIQKITNED